jgi:hypothetical protein
MRAIWLAHLTLILGPSWWTVQLMKLLVVQFSPFSVRFLSLRFNYFTQFSVLENRQLTNIVSLLFCVFETQCHNKLATCCARKKMSHGHTATSLGFPLPPQLSSVPRNVLRTA